MSPARTRDAARDYRSVASDIFRLALGHPLEPRSSQDWRRTLDVALTERCAALTWSRSGAFIRASAPEDVVVRWRAAWMRSAERAERGLSTLGPIMERLAAKGVVPVWLKGAPLAMRLYGDAAARETIDVDWFVEGRDRSLVAEELTHAGWSLAEGHLEGEQTFALESTNPPVFLEIHSRLLHPRFSYLTAPTPAGIPTDLYGTTISALLDGPVLSIYLALHLAGHRAPPLLWWMDYFTLSYQLAGGRDADVVAARLGLLRYVTWARRGADAVRRLGEGDLKAARVLGISRKGRSDWHPSVRHVRLAPPASRVAAAKAWVLPPWVAHDGRWPLSTAVRRVAQHAPTLFRSGQRQVPARAVMSEARGATAATNGRRGASAQAIATATLVEKVTAVVEAGGRAWVEGSGFSMWPFIHPGDRVLLCAPTDITVGSVVLTLVHGRAVLHRVRRIDGDVLVTAGDANAVADVPVHRAQVSARALAAAHNGTVVALVPTFHFGALPFFRFARFTARRYVALMVRSVRRELQVATPRTKSQ